MLTDREIPGQSLADTPRNNPYERPPETTNPLVALDKHLELLDEPDTIQGIAAAMEEGLSLVACVEAMCRGAVAEGIHSIDISMNIAPHIHEYIKGELDFLNVDYDEGFFDEEATERDRNSRIGAAVRRRVENSRGDNLEETRLELPTEGTPEPMPEDVPMEEGEAKPAGLMSRPTPEEEEIIEEGQV